MALALNKTTLKHQRDQLKMFKRFLPSLDLKRQQLLGALKHARGERAEAQRRVEELDDSLGQLYPLLGSSTVAGSDLASLVRIRAVRTSQENLLGTRLPAVPEVEFEFADYSRLVTPFWVDLLVERLQQVAQSRMQMQVLDERVRRLETASRRLTQRVNLFEKVLIPRAAATIRRIVVFLSDQERAAVVRSKIAKQKNAG